MNVALVTLAHYFHLQINLSQWVITLYLLIAAVVLIPTGRIADLTSRRDIYLVGVACFFMGSLVAAMAGNIWILLLGRALQGLGYGMTMALITILATLYFPDEEKGRALGVLAILSCFGLAVGPTLGGAIAQFWSWRIIFWMNLPICFLSIAIVLSVCPREKISPAGVINILDWPVIKDLFSSRAYFILVINRFLCLAAYGMILLMVPLYLQNLKNFLPLKTGCVMLGMTLFVIIGSTGFTHWLNKVGYRVFHLSACALFFIAYLLLIIAFAGQGLLFLILGLMCAGLATGLYFIGSIRGALKELPSVHQGLGMGIFYASALLGGAICVSIASHILYLNACFGVRAWALQYPIFTVLSQAKLSVVASGMQSFYQQNWGLLDIPVVHLHLMLMGLFQRGLIIIAVFGAGLTFLATLLAWSLYRDH